jgi:uncharacterized membrane protein YeaQ/YmgE (transglycosylase-associated protein family)
MSKNNLEVFLFFHIIPLPLSRQLETKERLGFMIWTIIVGIIAGLIAGKIMGHDGQGCLVDLLLGLVGGFVGGNVFNWVGIEWHGRLGQIGTAIVGAVIILWIWSKIKK